jgi:membrane-associated protease RseP (regulator of RpoE activity)
MAKTADTEENDEKQSESKRRDDRTTMIWAVGFLAGVALFASGFAIGHATADDDDHFDGRIIVDRGGDLPGPRGDGPRIPVIPRPRADHPEPGEQPSDEIPEGSGYLGIVGVDRFPGQGVMVIEVMADSPADVAGIEPFDRIVAFGDRDVTSMEVLVDLVRGSEPGTDVEISVMRFGDLEHFDVTIGGAPSSSTTS